MIGEAARMELDLSQLKFMMDQSKASRRKQSKPNRLRANEENQEPIPSLESAQDRTGHQQVGTGERDAMDLSMKPTMEKRQELQPSPHHISPTPPVDMELVTFPCHSCGEVFSSRSQQERHTAEHHATHSETVKAVMPSVFPTAYHRLANELALGPGLQGPSPSVSMSKEQQSTNPMQKTNPGTNGTPNGKSTAGAGVFQREAYCEICQREFCNKYFLKTHKANIHGIIDPNDPKHQQLLSKNAAQVQASNVIQKKVMETKPISSSQKLNVPTDREDYCDICQKTFCNKYYLKKHKMDVHNIQPDGRITSNSMMTDNQSTHAERSGVPTSVVSTNTSSPASHHLPLMVPPINSSSMNNMLFNPFVPNMAMSMVPMNMHPFLMHNAQNAFSVPLPSQPDTYNPQSTPSPDSEKKENMAEAFCSLCKKEFCNSYFLKVHRANKHGIYEDLEQKDGRTSRASEEEERNSQATSESIDVKSEDLKRKMSPAFGSPAAKIVPPALMVDAMMAAKQADRITCDICQKEVCNKYFLKSHKLKMHGVVSSPEEKERSIVDKSPNPIMAASDEKMSPVMPRIPVDIMGSIEDTSPENLAKMGIDPEAYCHICKKEFCSKYFLRTHKLNMHGIKTEKEAVTPVRGMKTSSPSSLSPPMGVRPSTMNHPVNLSTSFASAVPVVSSGTDTFQWRWKEPISSQIKPSSGSEKFTWRWKEPANATRVFCDLCNKELCNKYFLRTHKLNKHGISEETSQSRSGKSNPDQQSASSVIADLARATQQSMDIPVKNGPSEYGNLQFDANHGSPDSNSSVGSASENKAATRDDVCQICGMVFENLQAVNEHVKIEHISIKMDMGSNGINSSSQGCAIQAKEYHCSQCNYRTNRLTEIYAHEAQEHSVSKAAQSSTFTCKLCHKSFSYEHMMVRHLREVHPDRSEHLTFKHIDGKLVARRVKCNYCGDKFLNRQLCQSHIRNTHGIRVTMFNVKEKKQKKADRVFACDKCKFTCRLVKNLRVHQMTKHNIPALKRTKPNRTAFSMPASEFKTTDVVMQEFTITGVSGDNSFVESNISLPVYQPVRDEVNVSFTLTPTKSSDSINSPTVRNNNDEDLGVK